LGWLVLALLVIPLVAIYLWTLGALFYDAGKHSFYSYILATVWTGAVASLIVLVQPFWLAFCVVFGLLFLIWVWWQTQTPTHDRDWDANFAKLASVEHNGDLLTFRNVRNTCYRTLEDFEARFETRQYRLSQLSGVDLLAVYWGSKWICHPMLVFEFEGEQHLCISIELRYRKNQSYAIIPSLFRQNEIIYLVCDERDAILRRTKHDSGIDCYLYRLDLDPGLRKDVFLEYVEQINELVEHPSWYNALTRNCTTSVYQQRKGQMQWDWRLVVNGKLDEMLYEWDRLDTSLSFAELKEKSRINDRANAAEASEFSASIRRGLPGFPS